MAEPRIADLPERIAAKIAVDAESGCWEWRASRDRHGYGQVGLRRRVWLAHRAVYELLVGAIPEGFQLDHLCRVRHCVNPAHLEPVTNRVNVLRGEAPSIVAHLTGVCMAGLHPLAGDNAFVHRNGQRACRACRDAWREANRDALRERRRVYEAANREKINARNRAWREANRDALRERRRVYEAANRGKINARERARRAAARPEVLS